MKFCGQPLRDDARARQWPDAPEAGWRTDRDRFGQAKGRVYRVGFGRGTQPERSAGGLFSQKTLIDNLAHVVGPGRVFDFSDKLSPHLIHG